MNTSAGDGLRKVASNRKAFRDYLVLERVEAGIELRGSEVKSLREGKANLTAGFVRIVNGEAILFDIHIAPYEHGSHFNHEPTRPRRLLLRKQHIMRLFGQLSQKGCTLVPLNLYFRRGWAKVEIGLCKGRRTHDKREALRRKTAERELRRAVAGHG